MVRTVNFVAMGDSLTVGFTPSRSASQPYPNFSKKYADDFLKGLGKKDAVQIRIINRGVNGDLTNHMLSRFRRDVVDLKPDYVIILGGANDLGLGFAVEEIFSNLKTMFEKTLEDGIEPIGCTVPSILGWDEGIPPRLELNRLMRHFCCEREITCADLFAATCGPETKKAQDGLLQRRPPPEHFRL